MPITPHPISPTSNMSDSAGQVDASAAARPATRLETAPSTPVPLPNALSASKIPKNREKNKPRRPPGTFGASHTTPCTPTSPHGLPGHGREQDNPGGNDTPPQ